MHSVAVVQWSRLGDVLQTRVLLRALRRADPSARIVLFADARYAAVVKRMPERPQYAAVNLSRMSAAARHAASHAEFVKNAAALLRNEGCGDFEQAYVLTRSSAAARFAGLLCPGEIAGYRLAGGELATPGQIEWIENRMAAGERASVHLADVWATFSGGDGCAEWLEPLDGNGAPATRTADRVKRVVLLCDAGDPCRSVPEVWLAGVTARVLRETSAAVTLAGENARPHGELGSLSAAEPSRITDLRGRTDLTELTTLLAASDLVVGPDTGGLHLAAALGVPVIGLYFAGATAAHTGPYARNALVIENLAWSVDAQTDVAEVISATLAGQVLQAAARLGGALTPVLDEYGLLYVAADAPHRPIADAAVRREFFQQYGRLPSSAPEDIVKSRALDDLSIIIPECGAESCTDELLGDLENQCSSRTEIILVCSGSSAGRPAPSMSPQCTCMRSRQALTFAEACNEGARHATKKWLLFLNNDTRVPQGALIALVSQADDNTLLSPVIRYPDGLIQNAGVQLDRKRITEIAHGQLTLESASQPDAVSAVALLIGRLAFERLNGFDEAYRNGYEDLDLCLRAVRSGMNIRVADRAEIVHFRGSSPGRFSAEEANLRLFRERWGLHLEGPGSPYVTSADSSPRSTPLVIVSDEPAAAAGSCLRWIWPLEQHGMYVGRDYQWLWTGDVNVSPEMVERAVRGARWLIIFRPLVSAEIRRYVLRFAARGGRLLVDSDDLVFGRFDGDSPRGRLWRKFEEGYRDLLCAADLATVSTTELRSQLAAHGAEAVELPTVPSRYQIRGRPPKSNGDGQLHIGIMGTPSHLLDVGSILPAVECVLEAHRHVWLYWWGCRPGELAYHPRVRQGGPFVRDYRTHLARLHGFGLDVALVPLMDTPFARAKSPVKFHEYALAGVPAVYSAVEPYASTIRHGETGLLAADDTSSWVEAMEMLILDGALRKTISEQAEFDVRQRMNDPDNSRRFRNVMEMLLSSASAARQQSTASTGCPA